MANTGPSPGEVLQFADEEIERRSMNNDYRIGVQRAITWLLSRNKQHPLTDVPMKCVPGWEAISTATSDAKAKVDNNYPVTRHEYCTGVWECLGWINGDLRKPPRL